MAAEGRAGVEAHVAWDVPIGGATGAVDALLPPQERAASGFGVVARSAGERSLALRSSMRLAAPGPPDTPARRTRECGPHGII